MPVERDSLGTWLLILIIAFGRGSASIWLGRSQAACIGQNRATRPSPCAKYRDSQCRTEMTTFTHLQRWMLAPFVVLACAMFTACVGMGDAKAQAENAADRFHQLFNNQEFAAIYERADTAFKKTTSEPQLTDFLRLYRARLGAFQRVPQSGQWLVNWSTSGTYVTMTEDSVFSQGTARETFVWRIDRGGCALMSYTISNEQSARAPATAA
jgi:hypothetical protein